MRPISIKPLIPRIAVAAALLACLAAQAATSYRHHSNAFDESAYVGDGYLKASTGRLMPDLASEHPPLYRVLAGLAMLPLDIAFSPQALAASQANSYRFGCSLLHQSGVDPLVILKWARLPNLLLALLLGLGVFLWACEIFGLAGGCVALWLYCFEPSIVSHAGYISPDMGVACAALFCARSYERYMAQGSLGSLAAATLAFTLGLLTQIAALLLLPAMLAASLVEAAARPERRRRAAIAIAVVAGAGLGLALVATLAFGVPLADIKAMGIKWLFRVSGVNELPTQYLMGKTKLGGFVHYYVVAFFLKSTLPFLLLSLLAGALCIWRRAIPERSPWLLSPALFFLVALSLSQRQFGLRHALLVYPFLCVLAGAVAAVAWPAVFSRPARAAIIALLLSWHAIETAASLPHAHAYFNEIAGGSQNGHRYLVAGELDLGQDMPLLRAYLERQGKPAVIALLSTSSDIAYWIGPYQDLLVDPKTALNPYSHVNSTSPARELLIVNATYRAGYGLSDPQALQWLWRLQPLDFLAGHLLVYDITRDAWAHNRLGLLYVRLKQWPLALRQCQRAAALAPDNPNVYTAWGDVYAAMGQPLKAKRLYARANLLK